MKTIHNLIPDIYKLVGGPNGWFNPDIRESFANSAGEKLADQFNKDKKKATLRLSSMGPKCPCALWYDYHAPEKAEVLPPWAMIKFSYGHMLEALVLSFAKASGHTVEGEQDELVVDDVMGHRDCVIDGAVTDIKSASSRQFEKFKNKTLAQSDDFGYLDQLDGYVVGSANDPLVTVKDKGYLVVIDKTLGHMVLYEHRVREEHIHRRIADAKAIVRQVSPPACTCQSVKDGESGNMKLDVKASYNKYKHCCNPNIRTFLYANGPRFLTRVVRKPDVAEVDKHGKYVYH